MSKYVYVLDKLMKYFCVDCNREFILSEYQAKDVVANIICPYCHSEEVSDDVYMDDEDDLRELGCLGMGHHEKVRDCKRRGKVIAGVRCSQMGILRLMKNK